jgi:DNA-binding response OmpR family regulator
MPKKILIADDEPYVVKVLASRLKANNYDIVMAYDAFYAVKKAHDEKPDLIILDYKMPAGTGISVYDKLRNTGDTMMIPVIFITAYPTEEIKKKVMEMGAADFVAKPFDADELLIKIKKALGEEVPEDKGEVKGDEKEKDSGN